MEEGTWTREEIKGWLLRVANPEKWSLYDRKLRQDP